MSKLGYYVSMLTLLIAVCLVGLFTFWMVYPYKTSEFHNNPFPVLNNPLKAGDTIKIYVEYTRFTDIPVTVIARITDGVTFSFPEQTFQKHRGEYKEVACSYKIPNFLPPKKYTITFFFNYEVNPIRTITITAKTQEFELIE